MNTIKVYLAESGSVANLKKDFPLYQGQFQNKLLNIFVPTSITAPSYKVYNSTGALTSEGVATTSVEIGIISLAADGSSRVSKNYYLRYLKDVTYNGVTYSMYERKLPQEFTLYSGVGASAPEMVINVVNIKTAETESETPTVLSVITSQSCALEVMPSANLDKDESVEPTEFEVVTGDINAINANLIKKQSQLDSVEQQAERNAADILINSGDIAEVKNDIAAIEARMASAETPIGQMQGTKLPTNSELSSFVVAQKGRQPAPNDTIIFILEIEGETDKNYKYIYYDSKTLWQGYEIPATEAAGNGSLGTVKGTFNVGSTNETLVSIAGGEIISIYYLDNDGTYQNLQTSLNLISDTQIKVISGEIPVGKATTASRDQNGNVINTTYAKQADVYTKTESDNKYLPSTYTNIYYYSSAGIVDEIPTSPSTGIQFEQTVAAVGTTNIFSVKRELTGNYNFTKNSTDNSTIWVSADRDCTVEFRLATSLEQYVGGVSITTYDFAAELSGQVTLTANTPTPITIPSVYSQIGAGTIKASAGDALLKTFSVITTDSVSTVFSVYSNSVYPSTFNLATQSIVFDVNYVSGFKQISISSADWTTNTDGSYTVTITQEQHGQAPSAHYMLYLQQAESATSYQQVLFAPIIDNDGNITINSLSAIDCVLSIGSAISGTDKSIMALTNPTSLTSIDYMGYGAMRILQTNSGGSLVLPAPSDTDKYYSFFVSNSSGSTVSISVNGKTISAGNGILFKWNGIEWQE